MGKMKLKLGQVRFAAGTSILGLVVAFIPSASHANSTTILSLNGVTLSTGVLPTAPVLLPVPSDNVVDAADAVKVAISGLVNNTAVSITTNNASIVSSLSSAISTIKSSDGLTSTTINIGTGTSLDFYVFTKTSALSSFSVSILGNSTTYYLKGIPGPAYNINATIPSPGYVSSFGKVSIKVTDVFGNAVSNVTPAISVINLTATTPASTNADGLTEITLTYPATVGQSAIGITIAALDVVGLAVAKKSISSFIDVKDLVSELTAEKAARAQDKLDSDKKLAEAQAALSEAVTLRTASQTALTTLQTKYDQLKTDSEKKLTELETQLASLNSTLKAVNSKYSVLVKKYNALAKKFKQPAIKG